MSRDDVRLRLQELLAEHGVFLLATPRMFEMMLRQRCPEGEAHTKAVFAGLEAGVPSALQADAAANRDRLAERVSQKLPNLAPEDARWVVDAWADSLRKPARRLADEPAWKSAEREHAARPLGPNQLRRAGLRGGLVAGLLVGLFVGWVQVNAARPAPPVRPPINLQELQDRLVEELRAGGELSEDEIGQLRKEMKERGVTFGPDGDAWLNALPLGNPYLGSPPEFKLLPEAPVEWIVFLVWAAGGVVAGAVFGLTLAPQLNTSRHEVVGLTVGLGLGVLGGVCCCNALTGLFPTVTGATRSVLALLVGAMMGAVAGAVVGILQDFVLAKVFDQVQDEIEDAAEAALAGGAEA